MEKAKFVTKTFRRRMVASSLSSSSSSSSSSPPSTLCLAEEGGSIMPSLSSHDGLNQRQQQQQQQHQEQQQETTTIRRRPEEYTTTTTTTTKHGNGYRNDVLSIIIAYTLESMTREHTQRPSPNGRRRGEQSRQKRKRRRLAIAVLLALLSASCSGGGKAATPSGFFPFADAFLYRRHSAAAVSPPAGGAAAAGRWGHSRCDRLAEIGAGCNDASASSTAMRCLLRRRRLLPLRGCFRGGGGGSGGSLIRARDGNENNGGDGGGSGAKNFFRAGGESFRLYMATNGGQENTNGGGGANGGGGGGDKNERSSDGSSNGTPKGSSGNDRGGKGSNGAAGRKRRKKTLCNREAMEGVDPKNTRPSNSTRVVSGKRSANRNGGGGGGGGVRRGGASRVTKADGDGADVPASENTKQGASSMHVGAVPELLKRIMQLERLVSSQAVELRKLREECRDLTEAAAAFAQVVELLRQAGLSMENYEGGGGGGGPRKKDSSSLSSSKPDATSLSKTTLGEDDNDDDDDSNGIGERNGGNKPSRRKKKRKDGAAGNGGGGGATKSDTSGDLSMGDSSLYYEYYDDEEIFGTAPASVIDAADAAGASILAAVLAGKQRMLVDVRDAELTRDPDMLVQFIELAILPVAAGLEGLRSERNRVKIVFPTVSRLLQYRRSMALAAPEVVALSTLGFDPVAKQDNLVIILAPAPDDEEGLSAMNELLQPTSDSERESVGGGIRKNSINNITQPVVVLNHHMVPLSGPAASFEVAYHLRLLSVQYMTGDLAPQYMRYLDDEKKRRRAKKKKNTNPTNKTDAEGGKTTKEDCGVDDDNDAAPLSKGSSSSQVPPPSLSSGEQGDANKDDDQLTKEEEDALEAAMNHASDLGVNHGITRAMVIRAYPRPWHVFVDTSPDTDADFEVAATFDDEPSQDDVNYAIVECLEGSEREDELVAQQMQAALESGQLNEVSKLLGMSPDVDIDDGNGDQSIRREKEGTLEDVVDDDDDIDYDDFDFFNEESL